MKSRVTAARRLRSVSVRFAVALAGLVALGRTAARAQATDFANLSLEELVHYDVATLGRKSATVFDTPASVEVLSGDEIHAMGALTLPEALRLVPTIQVSRIDSSNYAIAMRGFNDATSSKLLVLADGRSVYNQQLSGTNWSALDLVLEDINRIEVQGGPAGALWGANAVNGVINIVSKNAHSTVGSLFTAAVGNEVKAAVTARHGVLITPALAMRVYAKYQNHGDYDAGTASGIHNWESKLAGTRWDWDSSSTSKLGVIAEYRDLRQDALTRLPSLLPPYSSQTAETRATRSADLSATWSQEIATDGSLTVLAGLNHGTTKQYAGDERHTTGDLDVQATLYPAERHEIIVGGNVRTTKDKIRNTSWLTYADPAATTTSYGVFIQDEYSWIPKRLSLTAGVKLERNTFSGFEVQPSLRTLWHPTPSQSVWAAVSQSARTPSRAELGVRFFTDAAAPMPPTYPVPIAIIANGDPSFDSEHVLSYEAGHRFELSRDFSVQTSVFYSDYSDLRGLSPTLQPLDVTSFPLHLDLTLDAGNSLEGHTYGGNVSVRWQARPALELRGSVSLLRTSLRETTVSQFPDPSVSGLEGSTPEADYKLIARWRPHSQWTLDVSARHTGGLPQSKVPAYDGVDARVAWMPRADLAFELIGRDLAEPMHPEIGGSFVSNGAQEIARSLYFRVTTRF